jgi:hypothetical protein
MFLGGGDAWRLSNIVEDAETYNITSSEMGHLFYEELGNSGFYDILGNTNPEYGLTNTGDFKNLIEHGYWSESYYDQYPDLDWYNENPSIGCFFPSWLENKVIRILMLAFTA